MYEINPVFNASALLNLLDITNVRVNHPRGGQVTLACLTHLVRFVDDLKVSNIQIDGKNQVSMAKIMTMTLIQDISTLLKKIRMAKIERPLEMPDIRGIFINSYDGGFQEIEGFVAKGQTSAEQGLALLQDLLAIPDIPEDHWDAYTLIQAGMFPNRRVNIPPFFILTFPLHSPAAG